MATLWKKNGQCKLINFLEAKWVVAYQKIKCASNSFWSNNFYCLGLDSFGSCRIKGADSVRLIFPPRDGGKSPRMPHALGSVALWRGEQTLLQVLWVRQVLFPLILQVVLSLASHCFLTCRCWSVLGWVLAEDHLHIPRFLPAGSFHSLGCQF